MLTNEPFESAHVHHVNPVLDKQEEDGNKVVFKAGDKVRCINLDDEYAIMDRCKIGAVYTVSSISNDQLELKEKLEESGYVGYWINNTCFELVKDKRSSNLTFDRESVNWDMFSEFMRNAISMAENNHLPALGVELFSGSKDAEFVAISNFTKSWLRERNGELLVAINDQQWSEQYRDYCAFAHSVIDKYLN